MRQSITLSTKVIMSLFTYYKENPPTLNKLELKSMHNAYFYFVSLVHFVTYNIREIYNAVTYYNAHLDIDYSQKCYKCCPLNSIERRFSFIDIITFIINFLKDYMF